MKKFKLIYNPFSGNGNFKNNLDKFIARMQSYGYCVSVFRACEVGDIDRHLSEMEKDFDAIGVSGGDGTINLAVNGIMKYGLSHIPLALIPSGTANDFCSYLNIPRDPIACCDMIGKGKLIPTDLGLINNDHYFINVCASGLFSSVSREVDKTFKDVFGKIAYYLKGMEELTTFKPVPMRITSSAKVYNEDITLLLALNTSGTGGINGITPEANINDGKLDFIAFLNTPLGEIAKIVMGLSNGEHLKSDSIIYFQDDHIKVENLSHDNRYTITDTDGEKGPEMPIEITVAKSAIKIFTN